MRDSFSPRHSNNNSTQSSVVVLNSGSSNRQQYQNRPPFSPTNPKNLTNRTAIGNSSSFADDHNNNNNDPWKEHHSKFGTSKLAPPNPEGRTTNTTTSSHTSTMPRVSSAPNNTMHRTFSRGRLMEGPAHTTTNNTTASTNIDIWDTANDVVATAWTTTATNTALNDDSTWFGGGDTVANAVVDSKPTTTTPYHWGRRTRSSNDAATTAFMTNKATNSYSPFHGNNTTGSDPWRIRNGSSSDSMEQSLYDDSGEKIVKHSNNNRHQTTNYNTTTTPKNNKTTMKDLISPRGKIVSSSVPSLLVVAPTLGSSSRPISTSTATTNVVTAADGSLNRPIPILDCVEDCALDERENDVLQNATRKQKVNNNNSDKFRTVGLESSTTTNGQHSNDHGNNVADDDIRDSDILQKATKRRQGLLAQKKQYLGTTTTNDVVAVTTNQAIPFDTNLSKIEHEVAVNDIKQIPTSKQSKGIMGFFRGGGLGGGKRVETKKKSKGPGVNQLDSPMSRSSRQSEARSDNVNPPSTFSMKRPSPLNVWAPSGEKPKNSVRSKSPANVWTALSDNSDETNPIWKNAGNNKTKTNDVVETKPIVLQATSVSNDKLKKSDIDFRNDSLLEQQGQIGSSDTHDDGTTVSGVTNPSFFPDEKSIGKKNAFHAKAIPSLFSTSGDDSFNVNSPVFSSGRLSGRIAPSPRDKITSTLPVLSDDDFSDPFFPNGTEDVTKEESGVSEAPDPEIDHVCIGTDIESDDNNRSDTGSRKDRHRRTVTRKAVVARSNRERETKLIEMASPVALTVHPVLASAVAPNNGMPENLARNVQDHKSPTLSRRDRNHAATAVSLLVAEIETKPTAIVPPKTMVSMRVVEMENKSTKPTTSTKRGSPFRRGQIRHRAPPADPPTEDFVVSKQASAEPPKIIQSSSNIPPIVGRKAKNIIGREKSSVLLVKSSSEGTVTAEPAAFGPIVKAISSNDDFGLNNGNRLGRSGDLSISSVGSDIQRLRSILRRSRIQGNGDNVRYIEPLESAFASYDEKQIKDPMQRAGLRLLSAAVVPIQSAIRRHLAFRYALTRMWAIVTIQAATRRWLIRYDDFRWATIKLQAFYRGGRIRDQILLEHCCAIEIQRHMRGLIASWHVYDEIHKIKLVQACARRKLAMERAMDRMVSIIQIQSIGRGFLLRLRQKRLITAVTHVQAAWRAFSCRFTYQLDILDIIIVQSVWRKNLAKIKFARMQHEHQVKCAVKIQSHWRSYDCSMNYLHYIADVLITQSIVRRYIAVRHCNNFRNSNALVIQMAVRSFLARLVLKRIRSAILIQSAYRGFVCYADYMFTISDIVLAQSVARRWFKQKDYPQKLKIYKSTAAITIQRHWRGYSQATDYYVMRQENKSATMIQAAWRRFLHFSIFIVVVDSAIRIQSTCRRFMVREKIAHHVRAAVTIQCAYRVAIARNEALRASTVQELFKSSTDIAVQQRRAVTDIQRVIRGAQVRDAVGLYTRTRIFQSAWRGYRARKLYDRHIKARCIQSTWRRHVALVDFDIYRKARMIQSIWRRYIASSTFALYINVRSIQSIWRGYSARSSYNIFRSAQSIQTVWRGYEKRSSYNVYRKARLIQTLWRGYEKRSSYNVYRKARLIQTTWRGYEKRSSYNLYRKARSIQTTWRGYEKRSSYKLYRKSRSIQAIWRGYTARTSFLVFLQARMIQSAWRKHVACITLDKHFSARRIQAVQRGCVVRTTVLLYMMARTIQAVWRGFLVKLPYKEYIACRRIQSSWRRILAEKCLIRHLAARRLQTFWRSKSQRAIFETHKANLAARRIQSSWRCKSAMSDYKSFLAARRIQTAWRGTSISRAYKHFMDVRLVQSLWRGRVVRQAYGQLTSARHIQAVWRGRTIWIAYRHYVAARRIQTVWRGRSIRMAYMKYKSACYIQAVWRGRSIRTAYMKYRSACRVQAAWRGRLISRAYKEFLMARRIQTFWRCKALCMAHNKYKIERRIRYATFYSVSRIQALWRQKSLEAATKQYLAAVRIQTFWRAMSVYNAYEFYRIDRLNRRIQYEATRKIQSYWRCKTLSFAYKLFKGSRSARYAYNLSALRIQTSWRAASLHRAFAQYIAARNIQAIWRRKLIRTAYLQFVACRRIQATWRCKLIRTAYKRFTASVQMQVSYHKKLFANNSTQADTAVRSSLQNRVMTERRIAVTMIAAAWRRYSICQRYWHMLGSVIEIQTIVRGWIARRELKVLQESALVQLRNANAIKYNSLARSRNSRLHHINVHGTTSGSIKKQLQIDRAARKIQRFFLMVKAEVDREIRAEKKRRKVKKKLKKKNDSFDEKLLESVWRKTIKDDVKYLECIRKVRDSAVNAPKHIIPKLVTKGSEDSRLSTGREVISVCGTVNTPMSASGRLGVVPLSVNSFRFDSDIASNGASVRPSKSRLDSMSSREIDEDLLLEEAWIDSKISSAKERRGGHRFIDPLHSTRSSTSATISLGASDHHLPPTMPLPARRPNKASSSDRRPPRRAQAV